MDSVRRAEYLAFFSHVGVVYQKRYANSLWDSYPHATTSASESVRVFLEGYAFERQGRPASYSEVAVDVLSEISSPHLDPSEVWVAFHSKLGDVGLNVKNNPLAPKGTSYSGKDGRTHTTPEYSVVEIANIVGMPLVQWVLESLKNDQTQRVHSRLLEITGVGPKIASFFLRDVACKYSVFPKAFRSLLQPVDIWVKRSADLLGSIGNNTAEFIVETSTTAGCKPEEVNQGMWYFGAEIVGSEYTLTKVLPDIKRAEKTLRKHLDSLSKAGNALSQS